MMFKHPYVPGENTTLDANLAYLSAHLLEPQLRHLRKVERTEMATLDQLTAAGHRYEVASEDLEAQQKAELDADATTIGADTAQLADLSAHQVPDDLLQTVNDAAAAKEALLKPAAAPAQLQAS